ncbi:MAG: hypothetical protein FJ316_11150 [SAR202 cluster bacterium]|nr:hypothetical protein [SAR202 cluster bacterium]
MCAEGGAAWTILPEGTGNRITWSYYFELTTPLISLVGALLVKFFFKHAMADALKRMKEQLEAQP